MQVLFIKKMEKLIFKEEQSFRHSKTIWIMLVSYLFVFVGFGIAFYQQLYLGKPFGDEPASNEGLIWSGILVFVVMSVTFILLMNGNLITEIWSDGVRYKFSPFVRNIKHIPLNEISSVEVGKYRPITEFGGWGVKRRFFSRKKALNVMGNIGLRVIKKDGSQIMIGTQKPNEMKRAVNKMILNELA